MNSNKNIISKVNFSKLFGQDYSENDFVSLDLSITNKDLQKQQLISTEDWCLYINRYLDSKNAKIAYGGYLETRNLYDRSNYFNSTKLTEKRNIHLGIDFWTNALCPVFSPFDAVIHSFKNNTNYGDYGPTIILKHHQNDTCFFSLYGHLTLESILDIKVGQAIKKGQAIGHIGESDINGDYAPHLHFQIILDLQENFGDFPGVCSIDTLEFYKTNCPNPIDYLQKNA